MNPRLVTFVGGRTGSWTVIKQTTIVGDPLAEIQGLDIVNAPVGALPNGATLILRGVTSNERYATREEKDQLLATQATLGLPAAPQGALIPIRKNAKWWTLSERQSRSAGLARTVHSPQQD